MGQAMKKDGQKQSLRSVRSISSILMSDKNEAMGNMVEGTDKLHRVSQLVSKNVIT
jgi:hypothetical protein